MPGLGPAYVGGRLSIISLAWQLEWKLQEEPIQQLLLME